jgi:hypothetical protein
MRNTSIVPALLSFALLCSIGSAQVAKPVVLGVKQLPGEFGKFGTPYTVGKERPIVFTLLSAEYRADRFVGGDPYGRTASWVPLVGQKLLVIKYSVQNPTNADSRLWYNSFNIIAVSPD